MGATPGIARADHGSPPWTGGYDVVTGFELRAGEIATAIARRPASVYCNSEEQWRAWGQLLGFDPTNVLGFVPSSATGPATYTHLSPPTCYYPDEFMARPQRIGQKMCQIGVRTEYRTETRSETRSETRTEYKVELKRRSKITYVKKVVRRNGRRQVVTVAHTTWEQVAVKVPITTQVEVPYTVTVQVPTSVPVYDICPNYLTTIDAIQTIAHESTHIAGVRGEAAAECYGLQLLPYAANRLGAAADFAAEIGKDYIRVYDETRVRNPPYWTADCYDGGPLDLYPTLTGWPAPAATYSLFRRVPSGGFTQDATLRRTS